VGGKKRDQRITRRRAKRREETTENTEKEERKNRGLAVGERRGINELNELHEEERRKEEL
jgi:hypothetical protein